MELIEIKDKKQLDDFVGAQSHAEFLQSWEWGEFLREAEGAVRRFGVEDEGRLAAAITFVKRKLPLGMNYFYAPRGPVINGQWTMDNGQLFDFLSNEIKKIAKEEKIVFLRIESEAQLPITNCQLPILKTIDIQPSQTIILDLAKTEDELLAAMHQKTRYNIRLAEKKGVQIEEGGVAKFEDFWRMMDKTAARDKFTAHDKDYYEKLLLAIPEKCQLFTASYQGRIIAAGIFVFFGDTATYLYGASADEDRNVMAPYLLQWEMIKKARREGFKYYDFFGISEKKWPGVTRFKKGFGGETVSYPGTFDVIFDKANYGFYQILRKARRLFR